MNSRAIPFRLLVPLVLAVLSSCSPPAQEDSDERPLIVVSMPVAAHLVEPLAGMDADVRVLLPDGASPHGFEPRPSDAILLARARIRIALHPDIDGWFERMTADPVRFVFQDQQDGEITRDASGHSPTGHAHDHSEDAHVWMDPVHFAEGIPVVAADLCGLFPDDCDGIRYRADSLTVVWKELDRWARTLFGEQTDRPPVVLALPFLIPLLDRYDVPYLGPLQSVPGQMHAPSTLDAVANKAATSAAVGLLTQTILNDSGLKQFAMDNGLTVTPVEPVGSGHAHYDAYIRDLISRVHAARQ
ncbi:MAG: metal ABC transporter substrate-binding protein [Rhodothermales bacterium]